ncbi:MAG: CoA-binding protein [Bryobacteraceae bacterium]|jgi:predicted CoA-binding protein
MSTIPELLRAARTIAVVGLSNKPYRPSYGVSEYMQSAGYRIIPVNPDETEVLGEKCYARLEDVAEHIDIVDIFRRPEFVPEIVDAAIQVGAGAVWMQEGVVHEAAAEKARGAGLMVVMDLCILKEHRRLG